MLTLDLGEDEKDAIKLLPDIGFGKSRLIIKLLKVAVMSDSRAGLSFFNKEKDNILFSPDKTTGVG